MSRRQRFRGESRHKVDGKGRVSIPANFRRVIQDLDPGYVEGKNPEFVIVYGGSTRNYLECFTIKAIEEVDLKIEALPRGSVERKMLERMFNGQAQDSWVDDTGRIVLSAKLREKVGITDEAFFIASGDTFQIWNPDTYEAEQEAVEKWFDELPDDVDPVIFLDQAREA
ncbi:division/cell wall cluster transcriptional repressor MraZ [Roseivivax isoporae]|uniref:Transcriptional regulator MraZ n=1 Tax=Roseivivax isoporae LMG 25204 TaxID=1449351 RepID=X7F407_9RHOB|nr:division/cell wall cluster transcriptional repressor MraZ [Roseivivax isoporae]ETX26809.1 cell division protein MraZ [Roseivivax isoporae LMG 25204]